MRWVIDCHSSYPAHEPSYSATSGLYFKSTFLFISFHVMSASGGLSTDGTASYAPLGDMVCSTEGVAFVNTRSFPMDAIPQAITPGEGCGVIHVAASDAFYSVNISGTSTPTFSFHVPNGCGEHLTVRGGVAVMECEGGSLLSVDIDTPRLRTVEIGKECVWTFLKHIYEVCLGDEVIFRVLGEDLGEMGRTVLEVVSGGLAIAGEGERVYIVVGLAAVAVDVGDPSRPVVLMRNEMLSSAVLANGLHASSGTLLAVSQSSVTVYDSSLIFHSTIKRAPSSSSVLIDGALFIASQGVVTEYVLNGSAKTLSVRGSVVASGVFTVVDGLVVTVDGGVVVCGIPKACRGAASRVSYGALYVMGLASVTFFFLAAGLFITAGGRKRKLARTARQGQTFTSSVSYDSTQSGGPYLRDAHMIDAREMEVVQ